ncbi:MAG: ADP-ribosylglycohydrolase family protein [Chloroflexota bacterium]
MNKDFIFNHVLGGLAGAIIGDAMGSATETLTLDDIYSRFGGRVTDFYSPGEGTFASGRKAGQITDDTSQMLKIIHAIIENNGNISVELVANELLEWAKQDELFSRFAGPTTKKAIELLRAGHDPYKTGIAEKMGMGISNGAAMKVAPAGWLNPGDLDRAVEDAVVLCIPTHNADMAFAGAGAVAAAIAESLNPESNILTVLDAALYGAKKGYEIGKKQSIVLRSPSMVSRISLAAEIAVTHADFYTACERLAEVIGCGLPLLEAVPFAIGVFIASRGDPNLAILGSVNMGGDADTTSTITGAITGSFAGITKFNQETYHKVVEVNNFDLEKIAKELTETALKKEISIPSDLRNNL